MPQWEELGSTLEMDESLKGRIFEPVLSYKSGISSPYPGTISPVSEIDSQALGYRRSPQGRAAVVQSARLLAGCGYHRESRAQSDR